MRCACERLQALPLLRFVSGLGISRKCEWRADLHYDARREISRLADQVGELVKFGPGQLLCETSAHRSESISWRVAEDQGDLHSASPSFVRHSSRAEELSRHASRRLAKSQNGSVARSVAVKRRRTIINIFQAVMTRPGGPEGIRTPDLRFRKPLLYPAELRDRARPI